MAETNRQVLLASRPQGRVVEENFRIVEAPVGRPGAGEVLVKNEWLSLDPYMRGRMNDVKSYVPPVQLGEVMVGQTAGEVPSLAGNSTAWSRQANSRPSMPSAHPRRITSACWACRG